jgi:hypothetical protein
MKWFRLYSEMLDDPKCHQMSDSTFRLFLNLLCLSSELNLDGLIPLSEGDIAWRTRTHWRTLRMGFEALEKLGIISNNGHGIQIVNWNKRQFKSDDVAARVAKHRTANVTLHETLDVTPPDTDTDKTPYSPPKKGDEHFDLFWKNYPKKIGKGAALKAWNKIKDKKGTIEKIRDVLPRQMLSPQWTKDGGQYIPHPATYLNQTRWEDEV